MGSHMVRQLTHGGAAAHRPVGLQQMTIPRRLCDHLFQDISLPRHA